MKWADVPEGMLRWHAKTAHDVGHVLSGGESDDSGEGGEGGQGGEDSEDAGEQDIMMYTYEWRRAGWVDAMQVQDRDDNPEPRLLLAGASAETRGRHRAVLRG